MNNELEKNIKLLETIIGEPIIFYGTQNDRKMSIGDTIISLKGMTQETLYKRIMSIYQEKTQVQEDQVPTYEESKEVLETIRKVKAKRQKKAK